MKKLYILLLAATAFSCSKSDQINDLHEMNLNGKVKQMTLKGSGSESGFFFDENGFIDSTYQVGMDMTTSKSMERDEAGHVLKINNYLNGMLASVYTYVYSDDFLTATVTDDISGTTNTVEYNEKGQKVSELFAEGAESFTIDYIYDDEDRKSEQIVEYGGMEGSFTQTVTYTYDENGFVIEMAYVQDAGAGEGRSAKAVYSDFELDDNGNWIASTVTSEAGMEMEVKRSITYYD